MDTVGKATITIFPVAKKATITIFLVPEAEAISNKEIEKQIKNKSSIPFLAQFESVQIEEVKSSYEMLRGHGIPQTVARNIVKFYSLEGEEKL